MERSQTDQRATDVAAGAGNALGGECPVRPHTFTCGEISVYLWCCHFCTFLLFLFIPVVFCCQAYFFSSSFNLLLSCLLSIIFFAPCPQPVMAQTLNLAIFSSSSSLLPGALCFFFSLSSSLFCLLMAVHTCIHFSHTLFPHPFPLSWSCGGSGTHSFQLTDYFPNGI